MVEILQEKMPPDLVENATLPGVRPVPDGRWLRTDDAYAEQMTYRRRLIAEQRNTVLWQQQSASDAVEELFHEAKTQLPGLGFRFSPGLIHCPDGFKVETSVDDPLMSLGQTVQEDICLLQKQNQEHVLTAAVLCFPASWTLLEK